MCMIDEADGDMLSVYRQQRIKAARKVHKCNECSSEIQIGEPYLYAFAVYFHPFSVHSHDKFAEHYYICQHCGVATDWLNQNCGGFLHNGVYEDIEEHVNELGGLQLGLRRLLEGMRRKWRYKSGRPMPISIAPANYLEAN